MKIKLAMKLIYIILIIAFLTVLATPIILNRIEEKHFVRDKALINEYINKGKEYYKQAQQEDKDIQFGNYENLYEKITGNSQGELFINQSGNVALATIIGKRCYRQTFSENLIIQDFFQDCTIEDMKNDKTPPIVLFTYDRAKEGFAVHIHTVDEGSGTANIDWCIDKKECEPDGSNLQNISKKDLFFDKEQKIFICAISSDYAGNKSEKLCTGIIK